MLVVLAFVAVAIVVLLIVGAVLGLALKLLWWVLIGLALGALARLVLPGKQNLSVLATALCGIGGSLLGGVIARGAHAGSLVQFLLALGVAAILVVIAASRRSARR